MPSIRLHVENTYCRLYSQQAHHFDRPRPSTSIAPPTGVLPQPHTPRPSPTQAVDHAPSDFPVIEQMPFKPDYRAVMGWGMADTTFVLLVFAIGVVLGVIYPPADADLDDGPRWEDELSPEAAAAVGRQAAERAARNRRYARDEGYETDREDN